MCCILILSRTRVYKGDSARIYMQFKFCRTAINLNLQLKEGHSTTFSGASQPMMWAIWGMSDMATLRCPR